MGRLRVAPFILPLSLTLPRKGGGDAPRVHRMDGDDDAASRDEASPGAGDDVDWDEVRLAYELSGETVRSIEKRFGVGRYALAKRRRAEGWTARPPIAKPGLLPRRKPVGHDAVELKLNKLVVIGMAMLEKRLAEEGLTEANARTLVELCRAEELRMRTTRQKTGKTRETKNHDVDYDFRDDPAWLDAEISRRLDRRFGPRDGGRNRREDDAGREAGVSGGLARRVGKA